MERMKAKESIGASLISSPGVQAGLKLKGQFFAQCFDKDGNLKWEDTFDNHVCTVGMNAMLDEALDGSAYSATVYMGLISSVSWSTTAVGDTMSSHAGWTEAGTTNAPDYSGNRKTAVWAAAGSGAISLSSALAFTFTEGGTVKGCFLVFHTGASATKDNTGGVLLSAGVFTGGDKVVANTDVLNVSYTLTLADT
jgi:hypothetical protein